MIFRESYSCDLNAIYLLVQNELGYNEISLLKFEKQLLRIENDNTYTIFVVSENENVVEFIGLMLYIPLETEGVYYGVIDLAVKSEYQGRRIGKSLINATMRLAKEKGVTDLVLNSG